MADVTGLDLMNYLNNTSIPIKTIVISGYNNFEYIRAALKEGGVDYLLKPIDADQLFSAAHIPFAASSFASRADWRSGVHVDNDERNPAGI